MKKKLGLNQLKVKSFVTHLAEGRSNTVKVKGGDCSTPFNGPCGPNTECESEDVACPTDIACPTGNTCVGCPDTSPQQCISTPPYCTNLMSPCRA